MILCKLLNVDLIQKYPHVPNGIEDPVYSIEVGIQNFADCLTTAKILNINDNNNLYLALQRLQLWKSIYHLGIRNI